jgi:hypothetical protein
VVEASQLRLPRKKTLLQLSQLMPSPQPQLLLRQKLTNPRKQHPVAKPSQLTMLMLPTPSQKAITMPVAKKSQPLDIDPRLTCTQRFEFV